MGDPDYRFHEHSDRNSNISNTNIGNTNIGNSGKRSATLSELEPATLSIAPPSTHLPSSSRLDHAPIASRYGMMSSSNEGLMGSISSVSSGSTGSSGSFLGMGGSRAGSSHLETWTGAPAPHPGVLSFAPAVLAKLAVVMWLIALLKPHVYTRDVQLGRFDLTVNTGMYEVCYTVQGDAVPMVGMAGAPFRGNTSSISSISNVSNPSVIPLPHSPPQSLPHHQPLHRYGHSPRHPFERRPLSSATVSSSSSLTGSPSAAAAAAAASAAAVNGVPAPIHVQDRDPRLSPRPRLHPPLPRPAVVRPASAAAPASNALMQPAPTAAAPTSAAPTAAAPTSAAPTAAAAAPTFAAAAPLTSTTTRSAPTSRGSIDNNTSIDVGDCRPLEPDCSVMLDDHAWPAPVPWSWRGLVVSGANCDKFVAAREMTVAMSTLLFLSSVSYVAWLCLGSPMGAERYRHTMWASFSILLAAVSTILSICVIAIVAVVFQREHTIPLNRAGYDYSMYLLIAGMLSSLLATASMTVARVRKPNYYV